MQSYCEPSHQLLLLIFWGGGARQTVSAAIRDAVCCNEVQRVLLITQCYDVEGKCKL